MHGHLATTGAVYPSNAQLNLDVCRENPTGTWPPHLCVETSCESLTSGLTPQLQHTRKAVGSSRAVTRNIWYEFSLVLHLMNHS